MQIDKPFFALDLSNEDEVLNWLKSEINRIQNESVTRLEKAKNNYLRFKGLQYFNAVYYPRDVLETQKKYTPQVVLPLISDYIDEKVARIMEFKPLITVLPAHDESKDKVDAKVADKFLRSIGQKQKIDHKLQKLLRNSQVSGESFIWTRWNPDLGEMIGDDITKVGDKSFHSATFEGDVELVHKTVHNVFYEQAESWEKVNYCFIIEMDYVEALKIDYPEKADKIVEDQDAKAFDFDKMESKHLKNMCRKIHFFHKKTKHLPQGYEACFVLNTLLKSGPLSYKHGQLPIDRLVDIENDEEIHGQSSIDKLRGVASNVNNLLNSMIKMFMLAGHAKWFIQAGSVDKQQLNNDVGIVELKAGASEPKLAQANPVGASHFSFMEKMIEMFYRFAKSNSVIQGNPPAGVTAGVALQYVSESESRRLSTQVANFNQAVRDINQKILDVASQYYRPTDKRTMLVLGKDNRWEKEPLDISTINKEYSVVIQNTSGLSDSKAVRIQQVIDLAEKYPDLLPREQIIEMTGLAQSEKAYDVASVAARAAEDENEQMFDNGKMIEPAEYEDHITHWKIHAQAIQPLGFKQKADPQIVQIAQDHLMAHEYLMIQTAEKNPVYMEALKTLIGFPMLADLPMQPPMPPIPPEAMAPEASKPPQQ